MNVFTSTKKEVEKVILNLKSTTFLDTLNEECKKKDVFEYSWIKFTNFTEPETEDVKGMKIKYILVAHVDGLNNFCETYFPNKHFIFRL